jgi:hypothetical protein
MRFPRNNSAENEAAGPRPWGIGLAIAGLIILMGLPRFTNLGQYIIVDESDRWLWTEDFVYALHRQDLAGTLIGHGYPGVFPAWVESIWLFGEAARRSWLEGRWIGEPGLYLLFHEWSRTAFLAQQRLPIVILNTGLALAIVTAVWRLFGRWPALLSGVLIALDPFYLSDSRINRAEAVITGLMTLSILTMIFYERQRRWRFVILSGVLGGLSLLTKIQALIILPAVALTGFLIYQEDLARFFFRSGPARPALSLRARLPYLAGVVSFGLVWALAAALTWVVVWPAMWVMPGQTLAEVYDYATHMSGAGGANLFFRGETFEDSDPGPLFYPLVFLMRSTPLTLLGLLALTLVWFRPGWLAAGRPRYGQSLAIFLGYILVYGLAITAGSHKQDRYLMPIFPIINIMAGLGLVLLLSRLTDLKRRWPWVLVAVVAIQSLTIWPHHPYYFSYFNPLFGGGRTAAKTLRIGWGEGMDQVGAYLAAKPDSQDLVVSARFAQYMPDFKGELISLSPDGRWTQADYIVLYIQQVQRRAEPSPAFFDYFARLTPEKVITLGDLDYVWIYPRPFAVAANPQVSRLPERAALLGYSWRAEPTTAGESGPAGQNSPLLHLVWENLGLRPGESLVARLAGPDGATPWAKCRPLPDFVAQAQSPGAYVESVCSPALVGLAAGTLAHVEFALAPAASTSTAITPFDFPEGRHAAQVLAGGLVRDVPWTERLAEAVAGTVPASARRIDRIYGERLRLAAYELIPAQPRPGDSLTVTLYWQPLRQIVRFARAENADSWRTDFYEQAKESGRPVRLTVQLADSRAISLGRVDTTIAPQGWTVGQVVTTSHRFDLEPGLAAPLAGQLEVTLLNEIEAMVPATTRRGQALAASLGRFTIAPAGWPPADGAGLAGWHEVGAVWQEEITLHGFTISPPLGRPGDAVQLDLYWAAGRPLAENYVVFVHLLDESGQIRAQSDALPRVGAYPTPWWQPGQVVTDGHQLGLPPQLPAGRYRWVAGLYRATDGRRLGLKDGSGDSLPLGVFEVQ